MDRYKKILIEIIHKHLPGCKIYLFGSRATKKHRPESDIDLAVDAGEKIDFDILARLKGEIIETNIPLEVDVVDLYSVTDELKQDVVKEGAVWTS